MHAPHRPKFIILVVGLASALTAYGADEFPKAGLQLWLSAENVEQSGDVITALKDLSGHGNDARRDAPVDTPLDNPRISYNPASARPVLRFFGTNLTYGFKRIPDIRTAFWVVSKSYAAFGKRNEQFVLGDSETHDFHAGWNDDTIFNPVVNEGHLSPYLGNGKTWLYGRPVEASKTPFPKALSLISIASTGPVRANQLARDRAFPGRSWQGDIAEILLYNVELSDADRLAVEKYLIRKYALRPDDPELTAVKAPAVLPGNGAAQHPFLYAGQWDTRKPDEQSIFIVREEENSLAVFHPAPSHAGS